MPSFHTGSGCSSNFKSYPLPIRLPGESPGPQAVASLLLQDNGRVWEGTLTFAFVFLHNIISIQSECPQDLHLRAGSCKPGASSDQDTD